VPSGTWQSPEGRRDEAGGRLKQVQTDCRLPEKDVKRLQTASLKVMFDTRPSQGQPLLRRAILFRAVFTAPVTLATLATHQNARQRKQVPQGGVMDHATQAKIHQTIVETLKELGIPNARFSITDTTILVQDGCYVGRSLVCGHVRVVMRSGGERIEFYDRGGGILRVICLSQPVVVRGEAA